MKKHYLAGVMAASAFALAGCDILRSMTGMAPDNTTNAVAPPVTPPQPATGTGTGTPADSSTGGPSAVVSGAARQNFTVVNTTGQTVLTLHVSSVNDQNWGPDILGTSVIASGATAQVTFERDQSECMWDIRAVYVDGDTSELRGINLCEVGTVTLTEN